MEKQHNKTNPVVPETGKNTKLLINKIQLILWLYLEQQKTPTYNVLNQALQ